MRESWEKKTRDWGAFEVGRGNLDRKSWSGKVRVEVEVGRR